MASVHSSGHYSQDGGILLKRRNSWRDRSVVAAGSATAVAAGSTNSNSGHHNDAKVEFASHTHTFTYLHQSLSDQISQDMLAATEQQRRLHNVNDMGPPLSRTLLLAASLGGGSLRSFSTSATEAPSDVVAHIDTDDCGGSMSEVSREEDMMTMMMVRKEDGKGERRVEVPGVEEGRTRMNLGDKPMEDVARVVNGRVSPGGTIYKVCVF